MNHFRYKYIIVRPHKWSGGAIVLSNLCKMLCEEGYDAKLFYIPSTKLLQTNKNKKKFLIEIIKYDLRYAFYQFGKNIKWINRTNRFIAYKKYFKEEIGGLKRKWTPFYSRNNTIVVYPESIFGNFLHAKHVVRWLLYYNRFEKESEAYGEEDLFICYKKIFNDWNLNPKGYEVCLPLFDSQLYKRYNYGKRRGSCYIIRKGRKRVDLPSDFDGPVIDYGMDDEEIVKIFNQCERCYSYDTQTFYTIVASVCGCIPIIVLEPNKTRSDYLTANEMGYGRAYGDSVEEIEFAVQTRDKLLQQLDYTDHNKRNIKAFLSIVSDYFKE